MKRQSINSAVAPFIFAFVAAGLPQNAVAKDPADIATVQIPRTEYDQILLRRIGQEEEQAPKFLISEVNIAARLDDDEHRIKGELSTDIQLDILRDQYTTVPVLPLGTKVKSAEVDGKKVHLQSLAEGLSFGALKGRYHLKIISIVDDYADGSGRGLAIPVPGQSSGHFKAEISGTDLSPTLSPALFSQTEIHDGKTTISAEIPDSTQLMLSWHRSRDGGFAASRGEYVGQLIGDDSVHWKGELAVEVFDHEGATFRVMPITTTMSSISVDGQDTTILEDAGWHSVRIHGVGKHKVQVEFIVPVSGSGTPAVNFEGSHVPVSRYELSLPGKKAVKVANGADVQTDATGASTKAVAHFPPGVPISFSWTEEVPREAEAASQINTTMYQSFVAEDGLLAADATAMVEVARGEKTNLDFTLPAGIQINKVTGPADVRTDWRVVTEDSKQLLRVFFERGLKGEFSLHFSYDRPLGATAGSVLDIPLLRPIDVQRSRGMIALLSSKEFSFEPSSEVALTRVGENQIPATWKQTIDKPVVHTFKYGGADPSLGVKLAVPEKIRGKLDAVIDTLISVGDVSMKGNASIDVVLKSGKLSELELELPTGLNILNVVAPSLRAHQITTVGDKQKIALQFTQEMEGTFLVQLTYERIFGDGGDDVFVPTVSVDGAEVEQGRVAVEALSAVEVQPLKSDRLSTLEPSELPRRLLMNTSNPILLGFKYFQADPPHELRLKVVRHKEVEPQSAVIDAANYKTLVTKDGIAITSAEFTVRNSRKQFLELALPAKSEIWSAMVDGKVEKPALRTDNEPGVLIRLVNSTEPFQVQVVYKTQVEKLGFIGSVSATLPKPDMVVSRSTWNVALPSDAHFGRLATEMEIVEPLEKGKAKVFAKDLAQLAPSAVELDENGPHFTLKRLYATEAPGDSNFSIFYLGSTSFYLAIAMLGLALCGAVASLEVKKPGLAGLLAVSCIGVVIIISHFIETSLWIPAILLIVAQVVRKLAPLAQKTLESRLDRAHATEPAAS